MKPVWTAQELGLILESSLPLLPVLGTAIRDFGGLGCYPGTGPDFGGFFAPAPGSWDRNSRLSRSWALPMNSREFALFMG